MNSTIVTLLVFGCTFGAALLAMFVRERLPRHHVEGDSREVVKLVLGLMATLTALVLGLLISSAHAAYDAQDAELQQLSVHLYQLDRILAHFGPAAVDERAQLRRIVAGDIARIWPEGNARVVRDAPIVAQQEIEELFEGIGSLTPKADLERVGQSRAIELLAAVGETRHLLIEQSRGALSWPFLFILVSWMTILFFGFGLIAHRNSTVAAALVIGSLSVSAAILLILQMNRPYGGWIHVSSAPLREALAHIGA